jgi:hypothetical protein
MQKIIWDKMAVKTFPRIIYKYLISVKIVFLRPLNVQYKN